MLLSTVSLSICCLTPATLTSKNSSRLELTMQKNFSRSSRGFFASSFPECSMVMLGLSAFLPLPSSSHANTALWIGNPGVTTTTNWSDNANWSNVGPGGAGYNNNDVVFGGTGSAGAAGTVTSLA